MSAPQRLLQKPSARCTILDASTFACGVTLGDDVKEISRTRFHFVLDNSSSMGRLTQDAKSCFAELVEMTEEPCSLVVFNSRATLVGSDFRTSQKMRNAKLPPQGRTNVTAGVSLALSTILEAERVFASSSSVHQHRIHHVLVLLSDGEHNEGPTPEESAAKLKRSLRKATVTAAAAVAAAGGASSPSGGGGASSLSGGGGGGGGSGGVLLSVVVVGVTGNSNTGMGMGLKSSLETVALPPPLKPIYFAHTPAAMRAALCEMKDGLAELSRGRAFQVTPLFDPPLFDDVSKATDKAASPGAPFPAKPMQRGGVLHAIGSAPQSRTTLFAPATNAKKTRKVACAAAVAAAAAAAAAATTATMATTQQNTDNCFREVKAEEEEASGGQEEVSFLCVGASRSSLAALDVVFSDGTTTRVPVRNQDDDNGSFFDEALAASALSTLLERAKVAKVAAASSSPAASSSSSTSVSTGLEILSGLIGSFEARVVEAAQVKRKRRLEGLEGVGGGGGGGLLSLERASPRSRLAQHKAVTQALHGLRKLKNELAAIQAHNATDSSSQAAFLNGASSKFATKAYARNAKLKSNSTPASAATSGKALAADLAAVGQKMPRALRQDLCSRLHLATRTLLPPQPATTRCLSKDVIPDFSARRLLASFVSPPPTPSPSLTLTRGGVGVTAAAAAARQWVADAIVEGTLSADAIESLEKSSSSSGSVSGGGGGSFAAAVCEFADGGGLEECVSAFLDEKFRRRSSGSSREGQRSSYLSLMSCREQLREWGEAGVNAGEEVGGSGGGEDEDEGGGEYEALMYLGALAYPIDIERRAATQMDPYAMSISRVRTSTVDTASLCCALKSDQEVVPPEGGCAVTDALILVDPDSPQASYLACNQSVLLGQAWPSVSLCRDLHMYTGASMRVALHARALASLVQARPLEDEKSRVRFQNQSPPSAAAATTKTTNAGAGAGGGGVGVGKGQEESTRTKENRKRKAKAGRKAKAATTPARDALLARKDLEASLRRRFLGRAYQCGGCGFGPIDHFACSDLEAHHGEVAGGGGGRAASIDNSCPRCGWFQPDISDWPNWDGVVPPESSENCQREEDEEEEETGERGTVDTDEEGTDSSHYASFVPPTRAALEVALRVVYSARRTVGLTHARELAAKAGSWWEAGSGDDNQATAAALTAADGVDHPLQLALALVCVCDDDGALNGAANGALNGAANGAVNGSTSGSTSGGTSGTPAAAFATPALLNVVNEACARAAKDFLKKSAGDGSGGGGGGSRDSSASAVEPQALLSSGVGNGEENGGGFDLLAEGRLVASSFLGVHSSSAPVCRAVDEPEPPLLQVREACSAEVDLRQRAPPDDCSSTSRGGTASATTAANPSSSSSSSSSTAAAVHAAGNARIPVDFEEFVVSSAASELAVLAFACALRRVLKKRGGGWVRLGQDMEVGHPGAYADVLDALSSEPSTNNPASNPLLNGTSGAGSGGGTGLLALGPKALLDALLDLGSGTGGGGGLKPRGDDDDDDGAGAFDRSLAVAALLRARHTDAMPRKNAESALGCSFVGRERMYATMAAQAFLHPTSQRRRCVGEVSGGATNIYSDGGGGDSAGAVGGGLLNEPLGDVRDGDTLRALAVDLRMAFYRTSVVVKMAQWRRVGCDLVVAKAKCADLGQYADLVGAASHAHGLDKPTFWGLWRAAKADGHRGEKVLYFLSRANGEFGRKYG